MDLSNISTHELHEELNRREKIEGQIKRQHKILEQQHRIKWLINHGGLDGYDQCVNFECRIDCTNCDDCEEDVYTPL